MRTASLRLLATAATALFVLLLLSPPTMAQTNCYQIVTGRGAGVSFVAVGTTVSNIFRGILGHLSSEPGCSCLHYHGILFGQTETTAEMNGCGWGCVEQIPCPDELYDQLADVIDQIPYPDTQDKLYDLADEMIGTIGGYCWSKFVGLRAAVLDELRSVDRQVLIQPRLLELSRSSLNELGISGLGLSQLLKSEDLPAVPPRPEDDGCRLRLYTVEGSGSNSVLQASNKKIVLVVPDIVVLRAEGLPPGGDYTWSISPDSEAAGFTATGNVASYAATDPAVKKVKIQVEYACPEGKTAKQKASIKVIDNTARK